MVGEDHPHRPALLEAGAAVVVHDGSNADGAMAVVDAIRHGGSRAIAASAALLYPAALLTERWRLAAAVARVSGASGAPESIWWTERLDVPGTLTNKKTAAFCAVFMELAGLEPATSWVRSWGERSRPVAPVR